MNKTILTAALAIFASTAFATDNHTQPVGSLTATASGANTVSSAVSASSAANGVNSGSVSYAKNEQAATAAVDVTGSITEGQIPGGVSITGTVGATGAVTTSGKSIAYNVSWGNGTGAATAEGSSLASVEGGGQFSVANRFGSINGDLGDLSARAVTNTSATAGVNESAWVGGVAGAGFNATATASLESTDFVNRHPTADSKEVSTENSTYAYSDEARSVGFITGTTAGTTAAKVRAGAISTGVIANAEGVVNAAPSISTTTTTIANCNNGAGNGSNCTPGRSSGFNSGQGVPTGDQP